MRRYTVKVGFGFSHSPYICRRFLAKAVCIFRASPQPKGMGLVICPDFVTY